MSVAGLTGGIASGKSTVASMLRELGCQIIDADKIAFNVVQQGEPAWEGIVAVFGEEVLLENGQINRAALGEIIFQDDVKRDVLNSIVHPEVFRVMTEQIDACLQSGPDPVVILDIPLLIETGMHETLSEVILVYVPQEIQISRLVERDSLSYTDALSRIRSQMPIDDKKHFATIIIDNSGSFEHTCEQVKEAYARLLEKS